MSKIMQIFRGTRVIISLLEKFCMFSITALRCVSLIVTDIALIEISEAGLVLKEVAPGWSIDDVQAITGAGLVVAKDIKEIEL